MSGLLKYMNHLPTCNKMQDWLQAYQALADTPYQYRDERYYEALSELNEKKEICTCGLEEQLKNMKGENKNV